MPDLPSHESLPLSGRLRLLRPLSIPFVLSLVAILVAGAFLDGRRRLDQDQESAAWEETARRAVGRIRAGQRLEDWIDRMSNRFQRRLEAVVSRRGARAWSAGLVERAARRSFDPLVWRSRARVFLAARKAGGEWTSLPWPGTPPGQARLVSRVLEDFTVLAGGGEIPAARLESLKRRATGLFGPVGEPAVMGRHQAGILTPVTWNGTPGHLVWNVVSVRGRPVGAYLFIFRRRSRTGFRSIRTSLDQEAVRLGGSHLPMLVPLSSRFRPDRVVLPRSRGIPPDLPAWDGFLRRSTPAGSPARVGTAASRRPPSSPGEPTDKVPVGMDGLPLDQMFKAGGRRFFRACLHPDRPWEIWVVSPRSGDSFLEMHRPALGAGVLFVGAWVFLGLTVLVRGRPWRVPMRVSFSGLFMLLGGLPLGIFLALGLLRIETSLDTGLRRVREEGAAALSRLDRLGGQALRDFRAAGHALLDRRAVRETLLGEDPRGWAAVASLAFRLYPTFHSRLDRLAIFPVRSVGRDYLRPEAGRGEGLMAEAGIAAATKGVHDIYWLTASDSFREFQLTSLQRDMEATLRSGFSQMSSIFLACKQRGEMWQLSPRERFFRSADLLGVDDRPTRYLYFRVDASPLLETLLQQGAHRLSLAHPADRFLVAQKVPGGVRPLVPHAASGFWRSRTGRQWLARFSEAGVAGGEPEGRDPGRLWLIRRADRSGAYLLGGEFALGPLLEGHSQARAGLWSAFAALLLLIGWVGGLVGEHLLQPLGRMQTVLAGVAAGNLETELQSARADELGELAGQFDEMIRGLRRRRDLARFVSGTLDARVRQESGGDGLGPRVDGGVVLVSDLRGFTSMSETHPPEEIVALLNSHIEAMTGPIHAEGGRIEQFIGDAIVALFTGTGIRERGLGVGGSPAAAGEVTGDAARAAVRAACAMRRAHLALQETRRGQGRFPYEMGVGIDGGPLLMGVIAGEGRAEFSVIGPAREGAEELEARSRGGRHSRILVADALWPSLAATFTATPGPGGGCREILLDTSTPPGDQGGPAGDLPRPARSPQGSLDAIDGSRKRGGSCHARAPSARFRASGRGAGMSRSLVVVLVVVLFVGATLALANWTRAAGARQWREALVEEATRETFQELDRVQTTADIESQIGSLLNEFAARVRAAGEGAGQAVRREQAWRELLQPNLPPHDLFVYGPAAGSMAAPLLFSREHPLGFGAVAAEYSLFLDSFTDQDPSGRPRSSFPDARIRELAQGIRDHVGAGFPLEPTIRPRADVIDFRTADRRLFLIWEEYGNLGKVVLLMDGSRLVTQFPLRMMAGRWNRRGTGLAFWDHRRRRLTGSGLVRRVPGLAREIAALAERHRDAPGFSEHRVHQGRSVDGRGGEAGLGEGGGVAEPVRFLIAGGPFLPGRRFRPVLVRALPMAPPRIPAGEAALFAASLLLFVVTVWAAVEGAVFCRRPAFPVRVVLVFAFVMVAILPLSGVGFFVHALTREWVDRERDRLARELHEDLRSVDTSFERTLASYTWQLRSWTRDPAVQARLERSLATDDPEAVVREFQAILERFRAHNTVKFAAVVGPRGLFAAWRVIFSSVHRRYLDTILEKVMQSTLSQHLVEFNPDLAVTGPGGPAAQTTDRDALYREMGYQSLLQIVGPQGFITMVAYPEEMLRVTLRATWLGMFSVPVPIRRSITFLFRWHLVNRELEYLHLQNRIGPHDADDPGNARFGVCGSQDYYFPPVPEGLDVAVYDSLLAAADQVFNSQIGMRFREDDRPDRRLVEIMVPRHLCSILVGTRATAWLDEAARRAHAAASLILFLILLAAILIGVLTANFFLEPLRALRLGAREIGRGNLAARLDIRRGDEFDDLADTFHRMAQGLQEGRTLGRFVSSAVRKMVGAGRMGEGPAPAHRCRATILFSQVIPAAAARGDPDRFFACLDAHLRAIEAATGRLGGEIDKIIGEKVLVVFSHEAFPAGQAAAAAAFRVARALETARPELPLAERLVSGITTGEVVSGVLGAASVRLDHTVIGDPVNLAARLADLAHRMDGEAVILAAGEAVRLAGWQGQARRLDLTAVKGKTQQVEAWRLLGEKSPG